MAGDGNRNTRSSITARDRIMPGYTESSSSSISFEVLKKEQLLFRRVWQKDTIHVFVMTSEGYFLPGIITPELFGKPYRVLDPRLTISIPQTVLTNKHFLYVLNKNGIQELSGGFYSKITKGMNIENSDIHRNYFVVRYEHFSG